MTVAAALCLSLVPGATGTDAGYSVGGSNEIISGDGGDYPLGGAFDLVSLEILEDDGNESILFRVRLADLRDGLEVGAGTPGAPGIGVSFRYGDQPLVWRHGVTCVACDGAPIMETCTAWRCDRDEKNDTITLTLNRSRPPFGNTGQMLFSDLRILSYRGNLLADYAPGGTAPYVDGVSPIGPDYAVPPIRKTEVVKGEPSPPSPPLRETPALGPLEIGLGFTVVAVASLLGKDDPRRG